MFNSSNVPRSLFNEKIFLMQYFPFLGLMPHAIRLSLGTMIEADIAAAVVLISMGALLGRTTPIQLMLMGIIEIIVYAANEYFQLECVKVKCALKRTSIYKP